MEYIRTYDSNLFKNQLTGSMFLSEDEIECKLLSGKSCKDFLLQKPYRWNEFYILKDNNINIAFIRIFPDNSLALFATTNLNKSILGSYIKVLVKLKKELLDRFNVLFTDTSITHIQGNKLMKLIGYKTLSKDNTTIAWFLSNKG